MTDARDYEQASGETRRPRAGRRAIDAYDGARDRVAGAGRRATEALEEAPLIALAGGLAAGALIAALLPRTRTEAKLLRPVTERVGENAKVAAKAAKDAGKTRLDELGLTPDKASETLRSLLQGAGDAARASAQAAFGAIRRD